MNENIHNLRIQRNLPNNSFAVDPIDDSLLCPDLSLICYYYMYESYCKHTAALLYAFIEIHVYLVSNSKYVVTAVHSTFI